MTCPASDPVWSSSPATSVMWTLTSCVRMEAWVMSAMISSVAWPCCCTAAEIAPVSPLISDTRCEIDEIAATAFCVEV
jgi:hypothetical protein